MAGNLPIRGLTHFGFMLQDMMLAVASFTIIIAAIAAANRRTWLKNPVLLFFGKISYSLYLVHLPVMCFLYYTFRGELPVWLILTGGLAAAILIAWLFNLLVEKPAAQVAKRIAGRKRPSPGFTK